MNPPKMTVSLETSKSFNPNIRLRTPTQRWKFRRNLVIHYCTKSGLFSQRVLADVFDLPPSRIAAIVKEMRVLEEEQHQQLLKTEED